jgi:Flp pilus assembly protein TadD
MAGLKQRAQAHIKSGRLKQAIPLLEKICKSTAADAQGWYLLGFCHARSNNLPKAEFSFRQSIQFDSRSAEAQAALAGLLAKRQAWPEAVNHFRKALALKPDQPTLLSDLGYCLQRLRQPEEAIRAYKHALDINPRQPLANRNLALLYEQLHQPDKARKYAELTLEHAPRDVEAEILLAKLDVRDNNGADAAERLQTLLKSKLKPFHYAAVNVELAKILDRLGQHDTAFEHLEAGKNEFKDLYHIKAKSNLAYRQSIEQFSTVFTPDLVSDWHLEAPDKPMFNLVFLVGFPRSGTTLTEQILEAHPQVSATHELPVLIDLSRNIDQIIGRRFNYPQDIDSLGRKEINLLRQAYFTNMGKALHDKAGPGHYVLDKLPLNIVHLGLVARLFPDARILVALRDPRDVCLSCYMQTFEMNPAMAQFLDLQDTAGFYGSVMNLWLHYRRTLKLNCLETRYEDIVDDLETSSRRLLDFIGLDWNPAVLEFFAAARQRRVYTPSYHAVTQPVYRRSTGKWKAYATQLAPALPILEPFVREFGY